MGEYNNSEASFGRSEGADCTQFHCSVQSRVSVEHYLLPMNRPSSILSVHAMFKKIRSEKESTFIVAKPLTNQLDVKCEGLFGIQLREFVCVC